MICDVCGFGYMEGDTETENLHRIRCDQVQFGPPFSSDLARAEIWRSGEEAIVLVDENSPEEHKGLAELVAFIANKEQHYDGGIYHACDPPDERNAHVYLYTIVNRAIGFLIFERRTAIFLYRWVEGSDTPDLIESPKMPFMWSVGFMWVHKNHRHAGKAQRLVNVSSAMHAVEGKFGWYTPFSKSGQSFVRERCPEHFFVAK